MCYVADVCVDFWRLMDNWAAAISNPSDKTLHAEADVFIPQPLALEFGRLANLITNTHARTIDEFRLKKEVVAECVRVHGTGSPPTAMLFSLFEDFDRIIVDPTNIISFGLRRSGSADADTTKRDNDSEIVWRTFWRLWTHFSQLSSLEARVGVSAVANCDQQVMEMWSELDLMTGQLAKVPARTMEDIAAKRVALGICLNFEGSAKHTADLIESFFQDLKRLAESGALGSGQAFLGLASPS
jgi:hypothetical protein